MGTAFNTSARLVTVLVAFFAVVLSACGGNGTPTGLAAPWGTGGGGGGGGGGAGLGGGQFRAVAFDDQLLWGPASAQYPNSMVVVCEDMQGATDYVLKERALGSTSAYTVSQAPQQGGGSGPATPNPLGAGQEWSLPFPTSNVEYIVEATSGGQVVGTSNVVKCDLTVSKGQFAITAPTVGPWVDYNTGNRMVPPTTTTATTQFTWAAPGQGISCVLYMPYSLELVPGQFQIANYCVQGFATSTSFDATGQSGTQLVNPAPGVASGKEYLVEIIGFDTNGWGVATTIDIANGPYLNAFKEK